MKLVTSSQPISFNKIVLCLNVFFPVLQRSFSIQITSFLLSQWVRSALVDFNFPKAFPFSIFCKNFVLICILFDPWSLSHYSWCISVQLDDISIALPVTVQCYCYHWRCGSRTLSTKPSLTWAIRVRHFIEFDCLSLSTYPFIML